MNKQRNELPISVLVKCFWKAAPQEKLFPVKDSDSSVCVCVCECANVCVCVCVCVCMCVCQEVIAQHSAGPDYQTFPFCHSAKCGIKSVPFNDV